MYLIGDIGNTEIKICLFDSKLKLVNKSRFSTRSLNISKLNRNLKFLKKNKTKINKIIFSSVVPNVFKTIKNYLKKIVKIKCYEVKNCNLNNFVLHNLFFLNML